MSDNFLPPLVLELRARAGQLYSELGKVGTSVKDMEKHTEGSTGKMGHAFNSAAGVGKAALFGIGGAAVAVGGMSLKLGTDFQAATTQLVTGAGESEQNIGMIRDGLIKMAPAVGMGPEALAKAMFLVESAGYHGADGLRVMKAAAEGAKIGGADATVVANGLTTAMTDYHIPAAQAAQVTSQLIATVAAGKTNMADLAGSLSSVLPAAASAHVGLSQVLGAMGTMTGQGISAQESANLLANTIGSLNNPSAVASKAMAQIGLNSTTVAAQLGQKGLTGTMQELSQHIMQHMGPAGLVLENSFNQSKLAAQSAQEELSHLPVALQKMAQGYLNGTVTQKQWTAELKTQPALAANLGKQFATTAKEAHGFADTLKGGGGAAKTYNAVLSEVTGGATGLKAALALTGANAATFAANTKAVSSATAEAGGHVKGWSETQKDFKTQIDQAKAGVEAMGTKIGLALIPVVQSVIKEGVKWTNWLTQHKPVMIAIAAVIGGVLTLAITAYVASLVTAGVKSLQEFGKMIAKGAEWAAEHAAQWASAAAEQLASIGAMIASSAMWAASIVASAAVAAAGWLASMAAMVVSAITAAAAMILPFLPLILTIGAIGIAAYELYKHWDQVWGFIKKIAGDVWNFLKPIFKELVTVALMPIRVELMVLQAVWRAVFAAVTTATQTVWSFLKTAFTDIVHAGIWFIKGEIQLLQTIWNGVWSAVQTAVSGAWNFVSGIFTTIVNSGIHLIRDEINGLQTIWSSVWNGIQTVVSDTWNFISGIFNSITNAVGNVLGAIGKVASVAKGIPGVSSIAGALGIHLATGGTVPGPRGVPVPTVLHGGEVVLSNEMLAGRVPVPAEAAGAMGAKTGLTNAPATQFPTGGQANSAAASGHQVTVIANTDADPYQIASHIGWTLHRMG